MSELLLILIVVVPIVVAAVKSISSSYPPPDLLALPKASSGALRGYMALMILWGHDASGYYLIDGIQSYPYPWAISALRLGIQNTGFLFVGIFFALSAYGCRKKWESDSNYMTGFLTKRLISVWMPFVLIGTSLGLARKCIWGGVTFSQLFLNCFDFNVWPVHWYMIFALLFYIAFYCVYSSAKRHQDLIMSAVIICYLAYCYITKKNEVFYVSHIGLLIGLLYAKYEQKILLGKDKFCVYWVGLFAAFLVVYNYPFLMWPNGIYIMILNDGPVYRMLSVGLVCICAFLFLYFVDLSRSRWLKFLGTISMEIYLVHSFPGILTDSWLGKLQASLPYSVAYGLKNILTILFTIILSIMFREVVGKVKNYMLAKYQMG